MDVAWKLHEGQFRKYGPKRPYTYHLEKVYNNSFHHNKNHDRVTTVVIFLHDVLEDCTDRNTLIEMLGGSQNPMIIKVVDYVEELTNPSKKHENLSREDRKKMDREHLKNVSDLAKRVKLCDRISNVQEICHFGVDNDWDFAKKYSQESKLLLDVLKGTDSVLEEKLNESIENLDRVIEKI